MRNTANMRSYGFQVFEHDPARPWVILSSGHHTIELDDELVFANWAASAYPRERFTVQLDAWGDSPRLGQTGSR